MHQRYYHAAGWHQISWCWTVTRLNSLCSTLQCYRPRPPLESITVGRDVIHVSHAAKTIRVWFDEFLSMDKQVKVVCKSAFFHLRNIAKIRKYTSFTHCKILIHAFITSKLDYCNSDLSYLGFDRIILTNFSLCNILPHVFWLVLGNMNISPILRSLHWLPIPERIDFKLLLLPFKSLNDVAPPYMEEPLVRYRPTRTLRSADKGLLVQTKYYLKLNVYRDFSHAAPKIWNSLPGQYTRMLWAGRFQIKNQNISF